MDKAAANKAKNAANIHFKKGDFEAALTKYNEAVKFDPGEVSICTLLFY